VVARSNLLLAALASAVGVTYALGAAAGCGNEGSSRETKQADPTTLVSDAGSFTRNTLLASMGQCALDTYRRTSLKTTALADAMRRNEAEASAASRIAAQTAFADAMTDFQQAELMQFGPYGRKTGPGGDGVRDLVYSWPDTSRCLVDETLVARGYEAADFSTKGFVTVRGLAAVEYLLFASAPTNACGAASAINAQGTWQALGEAEIARRRAAYARVVADDVSTRLTALVQKWDPAGGNFLGELKSAGSGSRQYTSEQIALNAVMDALFYADVELKDAKVGRPLGLVSCAAECSAELETPFSRLGKKNLVANLAGFRSIFFGCGEGGSGLGFDDLLEGTGGGGVVVSVRAAFAEIEAALNAIPDGELEDELTAKTPAALALHAALRKLGGLLKTEIVTVLNLELPARVEGDND
jgi:predicted lipoprotein